MSYGDFKRNRAMKGADGLKASPRRFAPYRKIVGEEQNEYGSPVEMLECGHNQRPLDDMIGRTYPSRRRCVECLRESCAAEGHPVVNIWATKDEPEGWNHQKYMRCKCGAVDEGRVANG